MTISLNQDFFDFLKSFIQFEVRYLIVGEYSVIIRGYNRTTGDLDIWVDKTEENYYKISKAFKAFGMPVFDMTLENFLNSETIDVFTFGRPPVAIDLMTAVKGLEFNKCFKEKSIEIIQGAPIFVISKKNLIIAKKASNRARDIDDLEHL